MKIETPKGSGNFIEIYIGGNGDMAVVIDSMDSTGFRNRTAVELFGENKGAAEPTEVQELFRALRPFAD